MRHSSLAPPLGPAPSSARDAALARTEAAYRMCATRVWSTLGRMGLQGADREDALQEVFLVVHRRWSEFDERAAVSTWVYGIAVRVAMASLRRASLSEKRRGESDSPPTSRDDPESDLEIVRARAVLDDLVMSLGTDRRVVFVLSELEGLPVTKVADMLAINVRTAYSRLRVARLEFARALGRWRARDRRVTPTMAQLRSSARERAPAWLAPLVGDAVRRQSLLGEVPRATPALPGASAPAWTSFAKGVLAKAWVVPVAIAGALAAGELPGDPPNVVDDDRSATASEPSAWREVAPAIAQDDPPTQVTPELPPQSEPLRPPRRVQPRTKIPPAGTAASAAVAGVDPGPPDVAVERLRRARALLHERRAQAALELLASEPIASDGLLALERELLQIDALCALGQARRAQAAAADLAARHPDNLSVAARRSCETTGAGSG